MRFYTREDVAVFGSVNFLYIRTTLAGAVFRIRLNRPEKRNAFTPTMAEEITFALAFAHYNPEVRCVIIEAEGTVFCAGADLNAFHNPDADQKNSSLPIVREEVKLADVFDELFKPAIAQVEGAVLAGGFLIICGCSFVISTNDAVFGLPEVKRGIWPMQVMGAMLKITTPRKFLEMAMTGQSFSALAAKEIGLVTDIFDKHSIEEKVNKLASLICENAPYAIQSGLRAMRELADIAPEIQQTWLKKRLELLLDSEDAKEGTAAFAAKRKPEWRNR